MLHDLFAVGFDEIAAALHRTSDAAHQLASRARVGGSATAAVKYLDRLRHPLAVTQLTVAS